MYPQAEDRAARIARVLTERFTPDRLSVIDESAQHAGHAGAAPGGETHFHVTLVAAQFTGLGRLARTRAVNAALEGEFAGGLHALSLTLRAPHEADAD